MICVSRREYEGSSPYSDEELRVINRGSHDERAKFLQEQGILLALFVDGIIQTLSLPKAGGVTVIGWSLGNAFTLALRACIGDLPVDTRGRLKSYARSFVLWGTIFFLFFYFSSWIHPNTDRIYFDFFLDPPQQVLGFTPNDPWPSADEFRAIFVKGVSAHYKHIDLDSKDPSLLDRVGDPSIKPTSDTMTPDELSSMLDFTPCFRSELPVLLPIFSSPLFDQMTKALVDPQVREDWGGIPVWHVTGDRNPWGIITSPWVLEDKIGSKKLKINVKWIKDANHFVSLFFPFLFFFWSF